MSITLRKYKERFDLVEFPRVFYHEPFGVWDLQPYYINESLTINRMAEFDRTFSFFISFGEITFDGNSTLTDQLTAANYKEYLFGIELLNIDGRSFAGQIDPENTYYDEIGGKWIIAIKDWLKYHMDVLGDTWWYYIFTDLGFCLNRTFLGPVKEFSLNDRYSIIRSIEVKVRDNGSWNEADQEWVLYKGRNPNLPPYSIGDHLKSHTLFDLVMECQKHYGAYLYIDENLALNFVNTQYLLQSGSGVTDITERIYYDSFIKLPFKKNEYDGILISQEELVSPGITEISWRMLRYIDGEIEVTSMLSEDQINSLQEDLELIDLRQEFGWTELNNWDGENSDYEKEIEFGYKVFPQRQYEDTIKDYELLIKPLEHWECIIEPLNLPLFAPVSINGVDFQLYEAELDGVTKEDYLILRKPADVD